jgi:hypothetical protein
MGQERHRDQLPKQVYVDASYGVLRLGVERNTNARAHKVGRFSRGDGSDHLVTKIIGAQVWRCA